MMRFTNEQDNALDARGRILVSAAAGSGKTAVLVEKVVRMVCDETNPIDIDKLLVVTFTNAAANEMKTRISESLSEKLKNNPENFHLRKQKLLLSSANICTIDSLCISLVREYFYKLGIPSDFKIADKSVTNKLQNACIDEIFAKKFEEKSQTFLDLVSVFGGERADEKLRDNILKVYDYLCSLPFPDKYIKNAIEIYSDFDENSVLFDVVWEYAHNLISGRFTAFKSAYDELLEDDLLAGYGEAFALVNAKLIEVLDLILHRDYQGMVDFLANFSNEKLKAVRNYSDINFREKMKSAKKMAETDIEKLKSIFNCNLDDVFDDMKTLLPIVKEFFSITKEFSDMLFDKKAENNSFDFSDIEALVLKLLVEVEGEKIVKTDIANELSKKFYTVLVDEYQDTNDLQNTIFNILADDGKKLFMVGDVKQSIYGFRKANPKNFLFARNELPLYTKNSDKSKVIMSGNFRSCVDVCNFVNFLFYRLFTVECGEMLYEDEDMLVPMSKFCEIDENRVSYHIVSTQDEHSATERQAYYIADVINSKIGKNIITDNKTLRPAEFKDVCILLRNRKEMPVIAEFLKSKGIPVWVDDNEGLLEEKEIVTLFSLLQVIDNPFLDVPLLATLTGDIYNFSADEVAKIKANHKKKSLYDALLCEKGENEKIQDFLDEISEFRRISNLCSVSSLISKILNKTSYENTVFLYENGDSCYSNLLLFKETAKAFENDMQRGLSAFVAYINRQIKNGNTLQKAVFSAENDNAVRIMTMHRSKGLQFPICILACLDKKFNRIDSTADLILTEKCGLGFNFVDKNRHIKYSTFPRTACSLENKAISQSEELRLLYVAMTRAKDFLIMVASDENYEKHLAEYENQLVVSKDGRFLSSIILNCDSFHKMIMLANCVHSIETKGETVDIKSNNGFHGNYSIEIFGDEIDDSIVETRVLDLGFDEDLYKKIAESLDYKYKYKDLNKIFVKQSASALAHREFSSKFDFTTEPVFEKNQKLSAAQKGTAMHKFMQYCEFKDAAVSISDEIKRLISEGKLTNDEADSLKEENLKAFFVSPIGKKVVNSEKVYKEQGFMVELDAKDVYNDLSDEFEGEKVIVQGFADLCFVDDNSLIIVDYKTDRAEKDELIARYKTQLDIYALSLSQTFNMPVSKTAIYSFYLKELIELN